MLEKLFLCLEEESAQRALKEEEHGRLEADGPPTARELADEVLPPSNPSSLFKPNQTWQSINGDAVSKVQYPTRWSCPTPSLYSLASTGSAPTSIFTAENLPDVTTVCVLKRSFIDSVRRRLFRARNTLPLPLHILDGRDDFAVSVSIEETTTVEHIEEASLSTECTNTTVIYSTVSRERAPASWVTKAKNIGSLFRVSSS